jgi:hypothetical protein
MKRCWKAWNSLPAYLFETDMKLHLDFDIKKLNDPIHHQQQLFLIGSCFTENIGGKLKRSKFSVLENPHGILFNPVSVAETVIACIENKQYSAHDFFFLHEGWHSWKHHSRFSAVTVEEAMQKVNVSESQAHTFLKNADHIMITLGSAWTYVLTDKALAGQHGTVAANNHKAPADWFYRKLMTPEEVLATMDLMIHRLFQFNPGIRIIFTISPVRHVREGMVENNRSKAVLIQAVHQLVDKWSRLYYFPAYELVIDDLRDYRFYAEDMVHPNYFATQYVWEKFVDACMSSETKNLIEEIELIGRAYGHKAFNPSSEAHKTFLEKFYRKTVSLQERYPFMNWEEELAYFKDGRST